MLSALTSRAVPLPPRQWACSRASTGAASACKTQLGRSYSQMGEDVYVLSRWFCDVCPRNYVEIGAHDGIRFSNTKMLEAESHFGGLLIEAHPLSGRCLARSRGRSGRNFIVNEAVCPKVGEVVFSGAPIATAGVRAEMASGFQRRWNRYGELRSYNYTVPCRPLSDMLRLAGLKEIHLFSLDVEGAELSVLQTMDWTIPVHVWLVELDGFNRGKDSAVRALLGDHGYVSPGIGKVGLANEPFVHVSLLADEKQRADSCSACGMGEPTIRHNPTWDKFADDVIKKAAANGTALCYTDIPGIVHPRSHRSRANGALKAHL